MEQYQDTLVELSQVIAQHPDDARALAHRGEAYRLLGRYQEALADFNRAIELRPDYVWAIAHRGEAYRLLERYQEALADFDQALELKPDYAWALAHRGVIYRMTRCYEEALTYFGRALELKPDYPWVIAQRGNTYMTMRRYEEALADLDRVIALDGTIISHWQGERGLVLNALGRYAETIACCEQALQIDPDDHIARYSLVVAKVCWQGLVETQAEIKKTQTLLQAVLQTAANKEIQAGALYRLGGLAALQDQTDQALTYLQEAISLDNEPRGLACHDPAWCNLRAGSWFQTLIAD